MLRCLDLPFYGWIRIAGTYASTQYRVQWFNNNYLKPLHYIQHHKWNEMRTTVYTPQHNICRLFSVENNFFANMCTYLLCINVFSFIYAIRLRQKIQNNYFLCKNSVHVHIYMKVMVGIFVDLFRMPSSYFEKQNQKKNKDVYK